MIFHDFSYRKSSTDSYFLRSISRSFGSATLFRLCADHAHFDSLCASMTTTLNRGTKHKTNSTPNKKIQRQKNHINSSVQNISLYYAGFILHLSLCFTFQFSVKFQFDQRKNSKIHFFNVQIKYFTFPTTTNLCENQRFLRC